MRFPGTHPSRMSGEQTAGREPRLALRFMVVTGIGLALAGALILTIVRQIDQKRAVEAATVRAHFVSQSLLRATLRPSDLRAPVEGSRLTRLDQVMRSRVLLDGALRVSIVGARDRITYSTDHRRIGTLAGDRATIERARDGAILSKSTAVPAADDSRMVKALVSDIPVLIGRTRGVVQIEQDYAPIAADARRSLLPVAGALELALAVLFVFLVPGLTRASRRLRAYVEEIRYRSTHDALTGLSNREALHENLAEALRELPQGARAAVLLIDLDRFKEVNDTLGHDAGDELLNEIACRLVDAGGGTDVSRLGGDEFAIVLPRTTPQEAMAFGDGLRKRIEAPAAVRGIPVSVDASIGIAIAPDDGNDTSQLVRRADVAMYAAKHGRAGVLRYDSAVDRNDASKLVLMTELRAAVERRELEVHYQPIVTCSGMTLRSTEALVRWPHPTKGMLQPASFLPLAEHTRVVIDLSRIVLREAIGQCAVWQRHGSDMGVGVNMTVLDLLEPSFAADVEEALEKAAFTPSSLTIEITEGAFMQEPARVRRALETVRALGVRVAIDDFGTGFSSLSYLRDLPVDVLKIDRSFVADIADSVPNTAIVASTIQLAHRLGLTVVAEGVENELQLERLATLGCDLIQGYLVSPPLGAAALATLMEDASHEIDGTEQAA